MKENPELARRAILMRKFGQEIIEATAGKKIHGTGADAGRDQPEPAHRARDRFLRRSTRCRTGRWTRWRSRATTARTPGDGGRFRLDFPSPYMSLVAVGDGALDLYRRHAARSSTGTARLIFDRIPYDDYHRILRRGRALLVLHEVSLHQGSRPR
jgi:NAD-reducing hydrogenase large subunit